MGERRGRDRGGQASALGRQARAHPQGGGEGLREERLPRDARERGRQGRRRRRRDDLPLLQVEGRAPRLALRGSRRTSCSRSCSEELPKQPDAPAKLRAVIELQLGLLEGERDLAEVITVILRQSTRLMKEYAAPKFTAYLDAIASVVAEGQAAGDFRATSPRTSPRAPSSARSTASRSRGRSAARSRARSDAPPGSSPRCSSAASRRRHTVPFSRTTEAPNSSRETPRNASERARPRCGRTFFASRGYLEVETPIAVPSPGLDLHLDAFEAMPARSRPDEDVGSRRRPSTR